MAILRPISYRSRGSWSVVGAGTALEMLNDSDDATGVLLNPAAVGDGFVAKLQPGGVPQAGDFTLSIRGRRVGEALTVEFGIVERDPGDGALSMVMREVLRVPNNSMRTISKTWGPKYQAFLTDSGDIWFAMRVLEAGATSQLAIAELNLSLGDEPVALWREDLHAVPEGTLVWVRMGDGRARQGKLVDGEWVDAANGLLELDASNFDEDESGLREAGRWVTGWGSI